MTICLWPAVAEMPGSYMLLLLSHNFCMAYCLGQTCYVAQSQFLYGLLPGSNMLCCSVTICLWPAVTEMPGSYMFCCSVTIFVWTAAWSNVLCCSVTIFVWPTALVIHVMLLSHTLPLACCDRNAWVIHVMLLSHNFCMAYCLGQTCYVTQS